MNILIHDPKILYFPIAKVANTSLRNLICEIAGIEIGIWDVHTFNFETAKNIEFYNYSEYFKFAFVRNPYDRLVSCYSNKIKKEPVNDNNYKDGVATGLLSYEKFYSGMSFKDFALAICEIPDKNADVHFRSQYTFLTDQRGRFLVDYIGKFENIDVEIGIILKKFEIDNIELKHYLKTDHKHYSDYFDEELIALVEKRYKKDLDYFNYNFNGIENNQYDSLSKFGLKSISHIEADNKVTRYNILLKFFSSNEFKFLNTGGKFSFLTYIKTFITVNYLLVMLPIERVLRILDGFLRILYRSIKRIIRGRN